MPPISLTSQSHPSLPDCWLSSSFIPLFNEFGAIAWDEPKVTGCKVLMNWQKFTNLGKLLTWYFSASYKNQPNAKSHLILPQKNRETCVSTAPLLYMSHFQAEEAAPFIDSGKYTVSQAPKSYGMCKETYLHPSSIIIGLWFNCIAIALYCNCSACSL